MKAKSPAVFVVSLFLVLASRHARAADLVQQVTALDDAATSAYSDGDFDKMKKNLTKALAVGKEALAKDPIMARVYLHLGVLYVDGLDNRAVGVKYFAKALKIRPDIELRSNMATKTVSAAFAEAGQQADSAPAEEAPPPPKASRREAAAERDDSEAEPERRPAARAAAPEKCRNSDGDVAAVKKEAREEFDRLEKALTMSKDALSKERGDSEKFRQAKMDLERQLNEAKSRVAQLESETTQKDKRSVAEAAAREEGARRQGGPAEGEDREGQPAPRDRPAGHAAREGERRQGEADRRRRAREKKERDANEKLEREKLDRDRALADLKLKSQQSESDSKAHAQQVETDLKQRLAQVEKEKAEKEKQLAATQDRERQERDAKEKLQRERQVADARDRERKTWEDRARAERDKVEAVPPLPSRIPEPLHCAVPEEVQGGADLFVQCVTQPRVPAKSIVFYYRPANSALYNAVVMDPTHKGWSRAVITANKLNGKLLQYYAEARDSKDGVAATNGKASSPNIVTIAPPSKR